MRPWSPRLPAARSIKRSRARAAPKACSAANRQRPSSECPTVWLALRAPGAAVLTGYSRGTHVVLTEYCSSPTVWLALRAPGAAVLTGYSRGTHGVLMWYSRSTVLAPPFGWACTPSGSSACLPRPRAAAPRRQRALRASRTRGILAARRTSLRHRVPAEAVRRSDVSHPTTNTLQHAATDDNTLQHVPACCDPRQRSMRLRTLRRRAPAEAVRRSSARRVSDSARRLCAALVPRAWRTRRSGG